MTRLVLTVLVAAAMIGAGRPGSAATVPYADLLGRAYEAVLDARFEAVEPALARACGPAPREACDLLRATALWWRIQLDPQNRSLDTELQTRMTRVIEALDAWTRREPQRAEAWFFLGASYGLRVQWRVLRTERLAAARDGKRIKDALERALALDPTLHDAYFGIGLYHYYADLGPSILKVVRWLLLLPDGDRGRGLREMLQAREQGDLLRGEADYQLHLIYLWYEQKADEALKLLGELRQRYPHNPLFVQAAAEVQNVYLHDHPASLATWRLMFDLARQRRLGLPDMSEARARLGIAEELEALHETDYAVEQLRVLVQANPSAPYGIGARALLRLGEAQDRLGRRQEAVRAYEAAVAAAPADDPENVRTQARDRLRRRPDPRLAEAYRVSLEGWRQLQRGDATSAAASLERAAALNPGDVVTRYRLGKLLLPRDRAEALAAFETVLAWRPVAPPTILAAACVEAGRLLETRDRTRAIELYRRATRVQGAEPDTRRAATQGLARLDGRVGKIGG